MGKHCPRTLAVDRIATHTFFGKYNYKTMSRPKPTVILQSSNKTTFKLDEVLAAEGIWAVFYDGKPINLKSSSLVANYPGPRHAENLAKKLNAQHNTDKFGVYLLKSGEKFSR